MTVLSPWRPLRQVSTLHDEIDSLFGDFFAQGRRPGGVFDLLSKPPIEAYLEDGKIVVRADLPGIDPQLVELSVEGNHLRIKGERSSENQREGRDYLYREVLCGRFERTVALPPRVDPETVAATYKDGVLEVTMDAPRDLVARKVPIAVN